MDTRGRGQTGVQQLTHVRPSCWLPTGARGPFSPAERGWPTLWATHCLKGKPGATKRPEEHLPDRGLGGDFFTKTQGANHTRKNDQLDRAESDTCSRHDSVKNRKTRAADQGKTAKRTSDKTLYPVYVKSSRNSITRKQTAQLKPEQEICRRLARQTHRRQGSTGRDTCVTAAVREGS